MQKKSKKYVFSTYASLAEKQIFDWNLPEKENSFQKKYKNTL